MGNLNKLVESEQLLDLVIEDNESLVEIKELAQELVNEVDDIIYHFDDEIKGVDDSYDAMFMTGMNVSDAERTKDKLKQLIFEYEVREARR